ncbi:unnamed protein product [Prunus armeniaca]|uniref:RNase H type-1 domain-containing protein n=1 Tax=Prunus armeniaca TaxID=36596 RepID=A0A6J5UP39_PRUAR|nr:unnamed protein product [Prunus armeniaca]
MRLKDDRNHFNSPPFGSHLWVNPLVGTVKINCVDAWDKVTNAGSVRVVIRDHTGSLLDGSAHCFQSSPVVQAQCHAIRSGLELVHNAKSFILLSLVDMDSSRSEPCSWLGGFASKKGVVRRGLGHSTSNHPGLDTFTGWCTLPTELDAF